jgi:hypothetical protein
MVEAVRMKARYRDQWGEEATWIVNDGKTLAMVVRGLEFRGSSFDDFEAAEGTDAAKLGSFAFYHGYLCGCTIKTEMPMGVMRGVETCDGVLEVEVELGEMGENGRLEREELRLSLAVDGQIYRSVGRGGWFEEGFLEIQKQLPMGMFLKACIGCAYSDYSPYGHGIFGGMACFRGNKVGYLAVRGKEGLWPVWGTMTEFVQETYVCRESERRIKGTGYRG